MYGYVHSAVTNCNMNCTYTKDLSVSSLREKIRHLIQYPEFWRRYDTEVSVKNVLKQISHVPVPFRVEAQRIYVKQYIQIDYYQGTKRNEEKRVC